MTSDEPTLSSTSLSESGAPTRRLRWTVEVVATVAAYIALTGFLFWPVLMGQRTSISQGDSVDQSFMWLSKVFAATQGGQIALWDFAIMSGTSFIGELQTAALYPMAWLFGLLVRPGDPQGFDLFIVAHYLIAALGFHLLCRLLGLSFAGAFVGVVIFAFGGGIALRSAGQPQLHASLVWMPWVVAAVQWSLRAHTPIQAVSAAAIAGALTALSLLAGHAHGPIIILVAALLLAPAAFVSPLEGTPLLPRVLIRTAISFSVIVAFAVALSLPQLVATIEYLEHSYKWYGPGYTTFPHVVPYDFFIQQSLRLADLSTLFTGESVSPTDGGTLFVTWVGFGCAVLAFLAIWTCSRLRVIACCAAIIALGGLTYASSALAPFGWIYYHLPVINWVREPSRGLFLFNFGAALLAAVGTSAIGWLINRARARHEQCWMRRLSQALPMVIMALSVIEVSRWLPPRIFRPPVDQNAAIATILNNPTVDDLLVRSREGPLLSTVSLPTEILCRPISAIFIRCCRRTAIVRLARWPITNTSILILLSAPMDRLGVRWWITDKPVASLPILATIGKTLIQERSTALPVLVGGWNSPRDRCADQDSALGPE